MGCLNTLKLNSLTCDVYNLKASVVLCGDGKTINGHYYQCAVQDKIEFYVNNTLISTQYTDMRGCTPYFIDFAGNVDTSYLITVKTYHYDGWLFDTISGNLSASSPYTPFDVSSSWTPLSTSVILNWDESCESNINTFSIQKYNYGTHIWEDFVNGISKTLRTYTTTGNALFTTVQYRIVANSDEGNFPSIGTIQSLYYLNTPIINAYLNENSIYFTGTTLNYDSNSQGLNWYLDGTFRGSSTGSTYIGTLPDNNYYVLTAKHKRDSYESEESNGVVISYNLDSTYSGFTGNGTMVIPTGYTKCDYIIVAGGGGGGSAQGNNSTSGKGGGGGAGGIKTGTINHVTAGSYSVVIGSAGAGGIGSTFPPAAALQGVNGGNSSFSGLTATGGGGGGSGYESASYRVGKNGGSGGGGGTSYGGNTGTYGTGISGQGYRGSASNSSQGGGGGGASAIGGIGTGGAGISHNIPTLSNYIFSTGGNAGQLSPVAGSNYGDGGDGILSLYGTANGTSGKAGYIYIKLYNVSAPLINPPSGLTSSLITCTGATLTWVNNNTSGQTGIYIREWNGNSWDIIATLPSGATSYILTGLTPNYLNRFSVVAYNDRYLMSSVYYEFSTLNPAPFNLNSTTTNLSSTITWSINDAPYGTNIRPEIRVQGSGTWITEPLIAHDAVSYTFTGLSWTTNYEVRFVRIGSEYPSNIYSFSTTTFNAPLNLLATTIQDKYVCLSWINTSTNDDIDIWVKKENQAWVLYQTVSNATTSICVTGLSMYTQYTFVVANNYGAFALYSNQVQATTTVTFITPFCQDGGQYTLTGSTCGNNGGRIQIEEDATVFYSFILEDIFGNIYTLTDYYWSGLTAGWYKISAQVLPKWIFYYGNESCVIDWIALEDSDTSMSLLGVNIRPSQCGPFDRQYGRIFYDVSCNTAHTFTFYAFNPNGTLEYSVVTNNPDDFIINNAVDCYYALIVDNTDNCHLLININCVPSNEIFSLGGIQKIWISPWSDNIEYTFWSTADDDYFLEFADASFFQSTKIATYSSISGGTIQWYSISVLPKVCKLSQKLSKVRQGFIFNDVLSVAVPKNTADKWNSFKTLLNPENRWLVVVQDENGNYWTTGYSYGAKISYDFKSGERGGNNGVTMEISSQSGNKLLTSIDSTWVKNYIIN